MSHNNLQDHTQPFHRTDDPVERRVALVVGASSGIGAATAKYLAEQGWKVYAAARRVDRLRQLGETICPIALDVTDQATIDRAIAAIIGAIGHIDALVNCAGWGSIGTLEQTPTDEGRRMFDVNVFGTAAMMQAVIPHMRRQGRGHIVNVASMAGRMAFPLGSWYVASKHAVVGMSASAAFELNLQGIQIAVIEPGAIHTEFSDGLDSSPDAHASGPYQGMLAATRKLAADSYRSKGVGPEVIAGCIATVLNDPKPRLHYVEPFNARRDIFVAGLLPARWFRRLVGWQAGLRGPSQEGRRS